MIRGRRSTNLTIAVATLALAALSCTTLTAGLTEGEEGESVPPEAEPTATEAPMGEDDSPGPEANPTATLAPPSATPAPTTGPTPPPRGSIDVFLYHDQNDSAAREEGEPPIDNIQFLLRTGDCGPSQTTTGQPEEGRYTFTDLDPGPYCVLLGPAFNGALWNCPETSRQVTLPDDRGLSVQFRCTEQIQ